MEKNRTFEEKMNRLEELVSLIEKEDNSLELSVQYYKEAKQLILELNSELEIIEENLKISV